ncbi:hypothetical protein ADZ36_30835 [Streptomyces fradiae]|uniref:Uncharacterized protein n=2 Tax=Streptomyces TaxID=1883 RepID=A0A3M8EYL5_9ACTN|nr:hypothetical protein ADZ36_30835 [Streptomyces fradiae]OFA47787.1 hypothetical protein BEN35_19910 [Streptomyces fradiae]PQM21889.1 hypothetical protein Sfr7A_19955 [Streptomyces xinghaiensis]RKM93321.1 hypothetical protein SFRA_022840 [Streptomyces xinghaiensis]RNC71080.1 hypothetical protein DC095_022550 [Streptomyces xinghaiensis]
MTPGRGTDGRDRPAAAEQGTAGLPGPRCAARGGAAARTVTGARAGVRAATGPDAETTAGSR